jgi:hypothetical protein
MVKAQMNANNQLAVRYPRKFMPIERDAANFRSVRVYDVGHLRIEHPPA